MPADKGVIFSAPMVCALLDGRKTQTRRLATFVHPAAPGDDGFQLHNVHIHNWGGGCFTNEAGVPEHGPDYAPYAVGDRLYVRERCRAIETGATHIEYFATKHRDDWGAPVPATHDGRQGWLSLMYYGAKGKKGGGRVSARGGVAGPWVPSIHAPRWTSRIWMTVTDVRVQRLQDISRDDAIAEGIERVGGAMLRWENWTGAEGQSGSSPEAAYALLWNSLHTKPGERWNDNPWVVAYTFPDVQLGNIDAEAP